MAVRSNHPGGANALFADGSMRFIKSTTALPVMWPYGLGQGKTLDGERARQNNPAYSFVRSFSSLQEPLP